MRLQPRHYVLLAILVALGVWNVVRLHRAHDAARLDRPSAPSSPAWQAYDQAAALRDAPDPQFASALEDLRKQSASAQGPDAPDLRNCLMWLQYYRHSVPSAGGNNKNWGMLATSHVESCRSEHRDLGQ